MNLTRENMRRIGLLILFTVALVLLAVRVDVIFSAIGTAIGIVEPFLLGGVIAFIINVPMAAIERKLFPKEKTEGKPKRRALGRILSIVLATLFILMLLAVVILWVVPELGKSLISFAESLQYVVPDFIDWLDGVTSGNDTVHTFVEEITENYSDILTNAQTFLIDSAVSILSTSVTAISAIANAVFSTVIGLVFACYILAQKENLNRQVDKVLHALSKGRAYGFIKKVMKMTYEAFYNFLSGQCIEAVITGTLFFIVLSIFNFPYAGVISVVVGFFTLIPIFGAIMGTVVGALFILTVSPIKVISYLIITIVLQQIEGNIIYPHVVGNTLGLPSIWVLVAVTTGGKLFGIAGMILFIPLISVVYQLFKEWVNHRVEKKGETA